MSDIQLDYGRAWDDPSDESDSSPWGIITKYKGAVLWGTDWTSETLISQLRKENIELNPKFQRRNAWDDKKKSKFIESIILGLPIPAIILAESMKGDGKFIVLDGKQRLLSLRQFAAKKVGDKYDQLVLKDLEKLTELEGCSYEKLSQLSFAVDYRDLFDNQTIRTVIVKNWPNQGYLHTVFLRLNTGSLPLSPQELRQALHPGGFIDYAEDFSYRPCIMDSLGLKGPDPRMRDVEITVRYFAFKNFLSEYEGNLRVFLDSSCEKLNKLWKKNENIITKQGEELDKAISCAFEIFGKAQVFSKWSEGKFFNTFNRPVYDIMTYYLSEPHVRKAALDNKKKVRDAFIELCTTNPIFLQSLERATNNVDTTKARFENWGNTLSETLKIKINIVLPLPKNKRKKKIVKK